MNGSKIRDKRQKKVQIELKCGYHGEGAQLLISLTPKQVGPHLDVPVTGLLHIALSMRDDHHLLFCHRCSLICQRAQ